jgi:hypothetical protein
VNYGIASFSIWSKSLFSQETSITRIRGALVILSLFLIAKIWARNRGVLMEKNHAFVKQILRELERPW